MVESTESIRRILTVEVLRGAITITMLAARFTEIELTEAKDWRLLRRCSRRLSTLCQRRRKTGGMGIDSVGSSTGQSLQTHQRIRQRVQSRSCEPKPQRYVSTVKYFSSIMELIGVRFLFHAGYGWLLSSQV